MCKTFRDKQLCFILRTKLQTEPFSKAWGTGSQIHSHVKDGTLYDANQLGLRMGLLLKVQAPDHTKTGPGFIVLNEHGIHASFTESGRPEALKKITSLILKNPWLQNDQTFDICFSDMHELKYSNPESVRWQY